MNDQEMEKQLNKQRIQTDLSQRVPQSSLKRRKYISSETMQLR